MNRLIRYREGYFNGAREVRLFYRHWELAEPKAVVVRVHGFGSHSGRSKHVVEFLIERDLNVSSYDQRGHGKSEGIRGYVDSFQEFLDDLHRFVKLSRIAGTPTFLLGSSMGGLISLLYSIKNPRIIEGVVASAPFLKTGSDVTLSTEHVEEILKMATNHPMTFFKFGNAQDIRSQKEEDELMHDIMSVKLFSEILSAQKTVFDFARFITVPSLLLHGSADTVADPAGSRELFDRITNSDKKLIIYKSVKHVLLGNNRESGPVLTDIVNWMNDHIKTYYRQWD
ncbi:MAG TPA: alpha/beta hydrolase [Candidatus Acidoferrum sp.]|nr:alpha/beta hydrolase [Candidatus Acidoferrum sp.]